MASPVVLNTKNKTAIFTSDCSIMNFSEKNILIFQLMDDPPYCLASLDMKNKEIYIF